MSTEKIKIAKKDWIHSIIMFILMFGFKFLPAPYPITEYGMAVAGTFIGMIYGWSTLGMLWPSLLGGLSLVAAGYGTFEQLILAAFGNSTVWMMVFGMLVFAGLNSTGATDVLLNKFLSSKSVKKNPYIFVWGMLGISAFIGGFLGQSIVLFIILIPLFDELFTACSYPRGDRFGVLLVGGMILAASFGMLLPPWAPWVLLFTSTATAATGMVPLSFGAHFILLLILTVIFIAIYPFFMKLLRCDFSKLNSDSNSFSYGEGKSTSLNLSQKLTLLIMGTFLLLMLIISIFASYIPFLALINTKLGVLGMMAIVWIIYCFIKIDGTPLLNALILLKQSAGISLFYLLLLWSYPINSLAKPPVSVSFYQIYYRQFLLDIVDCISLLSSGF